MKISIRNVRRIERADIEIPEAGLGLLAGGNEQGKTSLCQSVAAALTGDAILVQGLTKARAGVLVRDGADGGEIKVSDGDWSVTVAYPACEVSSKGNPPALSRFAAGLDSIVDMNIKDRAAALGPYLKASPTREDLETRLRDGGIPDDMINRIWEVVDRDGWDAAWSKARESGQTIKGRWCEATGSRSYGSKIAETWAPAGWTPELEDAALDALEKDVAAARVDLEQAIRDGASNEAEVKRLRALADGLEEKRAALEDARKAFEQAEKDRTTAEIRRKNLPPADSEKTCECPHCGEPVVVTPGRPGEHTLHKPTGEKIGEDERKKRRLEKSAADGEVSRLASAANEKQRAMVDLERAVAEAEKAVEALAGMTETSGDHEAVQKARDALAACEARFAAKKAKVTADKLARSVKANQFVVDTLAPDGVRKTILERAIDAFNGHYLEPLCKAAKIRTVELRPDLAVTYGGRSFALLSESAQWRVRAVLAFVMAQIDGSPLVILDRADVIEPALRDQVVLLARAAQVPALVAMTFSKPDVVPDLQKAGLGVAYWIEGGITAPLGDANRAREAA